MAEYNADAVQAEIDKDKAIGKQEGKAIHALLKGRARGMTCVQCGGLALGYAVENENREIVCRECDDDRFLAIIAELEREKKEKDMAKEQQVTRVCGECGSEDVRLLAWTEWNIDQQRWVLSENYSYINPFTGEDTFWCIDCEMTIDETPEKQITG